MEDNLDAAMKASEFFNSALYSINNIPILRGEYYGVEIENELEMELPAAAQRAVISGTYFNIKGDGSLRLNGYEFVSATLSYNDIKSQITQLCDIVKNYEWTNSRRTSTHIHMNFADKTPYDIVKFACTYWIFEPLLFQSVNPIRRDNTFCVSTSVTKWSLVKAAEKQDFFKTWNENQDKYASLNLCPLSRLGTVESRIFHATFDKDELHRWIDTLHHLRQFAAKRTLSEIKKDFIDLPPKALVQLMVGEKLAEHYFALARNEGIDVDTLIREGYNATRPVFRIEEMFNKAKAFFDEAKQEYERLKSLPMPEDDGSLLGWLDKRAHEAKLSKFKNLLEKKEEKRPAYDPGGFADIRQQVHFFGGLGGGRVVREDVAPPQPLAEMDIRQIWQVIDDLEPNIVREPWPEGEQQEEEQEGEEE